MKTASKRKTRAIVRRKHRTPKQALMRIPAPPAQPWNLTLNEVQLVKNHIAKGSTDKELEFCLAVARRHKLDPFRGQIWFVKRRDQTAEGGYRWIPIVGINGLLSVAARDHKDFGTVGEPEFGPMHKVTFQKNGQGKSETVNAPEWARVQIWKKGLEHPTTATVYWDEIYPNIDYAPLVRQMPRLMLGKCCIAQGTRRTYPATDGLYIKEEFQGPPEFTPGGRIMEVSPKQVEAEKNWERREAEGMEKLTTAQREIAEKKIEEAATKIIAIISYPAKEDGDVELRTDTATAAYAGLKRAHATNAGVWLIKHSTITKFHDMCRDKGITVNEEVGNAERP